MKKENPRQGKKECARTVLAMVFVGMFILTAATWVGIGSGDGEGTRSGDDLVLELHFDEGSGTTVYDSSGNGNDGTIYGASWASGVSGHALDFDGLDDYVRITDSDSLDLIDSLTIEAWIYPKSREPSSRGDWIVSKWRDSDNQRSYSFSITKDSKLSGQYCMTGYDGDYHWIGSDTQIPVNEWTHVAWTIGNSISNLYINGELEKSASVSGSIFTGNADVIIGQYDGFPYDDWFEGSIDDVQIYNAALSAEEIQEHYESFALSVWTDKDIYSPGEQVTLTANYNGENASKVTFEVVDSDGTTMVVETEDLAWEPREWTKYQGNPVFDMGDTGSWDSSAVYSPSIIYHEGLYHMWYSGEPYPSQIGHAQSINGYEWTREPSNPVISAQAWFSAIAWSTVIWDEPSGEFQMWFTGYDPISKIGYANSTDGVNWNVFPTPVFTSTQAWESGHVQGPYVIGNSNTGYTLWYAGAATPYAIGYATSPDGISWTPYSGNPVLTADESWEGGIVRDPSVCQNSGEYIMWYRGGSSIGVARSNDGINWTKEPSNPILTSMNEGWESDQLECPDVIIENKTLRLWYCGGSSQSPVRIGHATSIIRYSASTTFTLPSGTLTGTYTVYASCIDSTANTTFKVMLPEIKIGEVVIPTNIHRGDSIDFNIWIENGFVESQDILIVIQVLDKNNTPFPPIHEYVTIEGINAKLVTMTMDIPLGCPVGTYLAQTQLLTEFPRNGGYALDYRNDDFEVT